MIGTAARALALSLALCGALSAAAFADTYRGSAVEDEQMPVKVKLTGRDVIFDYTDVLVACSDGSQVRQGGAQHADRLNARDRFRDTIESHGVTSVVKGRISAERAIGTVAYDLVYGGGECHSGKLEWKARRKQQATAPSHAL
jgi:uncharacterized protein (UPF0264 family)